MKNYTQENQIQAERQALGSMLIDPRCVPQVVGALRPGCFQEPTNRAIYEAICKLFCGQNLIDGITVLNAIAADFPEQEAAFREAICRLIDDTPTSIGVMDAVAFLIKSGNSGSAPLSSGNP